MKKLFLFLFLSFLVNGHASSHSLLESVNSDHRIEKNTLRDKYSYAYDTVSFFRIDR